MKVKHARREATQLKRQLKTTESFPEGELSVENLNPRGGIVKPLEMTVRRSRQLAALCRQHLDLCEGDPDRARHESPAGWGSLEIRKMKKVDGKIAPINPRKYLREIWGDQWYVQPEYLAWSDTFDRWWSGSLEKCEQALLTNLPLAVRKKYE